MSGEVRKIENTEPAPGKSGIGSEDPTKSEYKVGRGRPPLNTRFKPGQSGFPSGRPAGRRNVKTMLKEVMNKKVTVRDGEKTRQVPILQALVEAHAVKGVKGDQSSARLFINMLETFGAISEQDEESIQTQQDAGSSRSTHRSPSRELFENIDLALLSDDDQVELSRLAEIVDLGGGITALSIPDFAKAQSIVNRGRGRDITPGT